MKIHFTITNSGTALTLWQSFYLDALLVMLVGVASVRCVLSMDSSQEVQLHRMLGHPVLELVEELTAARQAEAPLVQLDTGQTFDMENSSFLLKHLSVRPC